MMFVLLANKTKNIKYIDQQNNNNNIVKIILSVVLITLFLILSIVLNSKSTNYDADSNSGESSKSLDSIIHTQKVIDKKPTKLKKEESPITSIKDMLLTYKKDFTKKKSIITHQKFIEKQNIENYNNIKNQINNDIINDILTDITRIHHINNLWYKFINYYLPKYKENQSNAINEVVKNIFTKLMLNILISNNIDISDNIYEAIKNNINHLYQYIEHFILVPHAITTSNDVIKEKLYNTLSKLLGIKPSKKDEHIADVFNRFLYQYKKEEIAVFATEIIAKLYYPNSPYQKYSLYKNIFKYIERQMNNNHEIIPFNNKIIEKTIKEKKKPLTLLEVLIREIINKNILDFSNKKIAITDDIVNNYHELIQKIKTNINLYDDIEIIIRKLSSIDILKFKDLYNIYNMDNIEYDCPKVLQEPLDNNNRDVLHRYSLQIPENILNLTKSNSNMITKLFKKISLAWNFNPTLESLANNIEHIICNIDNNTISSAIHQQIYYFNKQCIKAEQINTIEVKQIIDDIFIDIYDNIQENFNKDSYINHINNLNDDYCYLLLGPDTTNTLLTLNTKQPTNSIQEPSRLLSHILYLLFINKNNTVLVNLIVFLFYFKKRIEKMPNIDQNIPYIKNCCHIIKIIETITTYSSYFILYTEQDHSIT